MPKTSSKVCKSFVNQNLITMLQMEANRSKNVEQTKQPGVDETVVDETGVDELGYYHRCHLGKTLDQLN